MRLCGKQKKITSQKGKGDAYFVLDNQLVDFQLTATDSDVAPGQKLILIGSGDGVLSSGLSLSPAEKFPE